MRKQTAEKVADLLALTEALLEGGRPRAMPGRHRPQAILMDGTVIRRVGKDTSLLQIKQLSLAGALRMAALDQEYGPYIQRVARQEIGWAAYNNPKLTPDYGVSSVSVLDDAYDTREIVRAVRRARRSLERYELS